MPVFHFNIVIGGDVVADLEGTELSSIEDAHAAALEDARELMSDAVLAGRDISERSIQICNEAGDILQVVRFADAIRPGD